MYDVRLRIAKTGKMKYVSHLDMFRLMQRAVRRAEIPLWYTEGFNPHPYISFLLALSLGVEGLKEPVDIRITENISNAEIRDRLNAVMPPELRVVDVFTPFNKPAQIAYGEYEIALSKNDVSAGELFNALESGNLFCEKSGKQGKKKIIKTVNVSEHIKKYSIEENGDILKLNIVLPAGSVFNLNPGQLLEGVSGYLEKEVVPVSAVRTGLLCGDMSEFV